MRLCRGRVHWPLSVHCLLVALLDRELAPVTGRSWDKAQQMRKSRLGPKKPGSMVRTEAKVGGRDRLDLSRDELKLAKPWCLRDAHHTWGPRASQTQNSGGGRRVAEDKSRGPGVPRSGSPLYRPPFLEGVLRLEPFVRVSL